MSGSPEAVESQGPVTRVYVVRHGETDWNASGKIQGHSASHLNDKGRAQAAAAANYLAGCGIERVFASDLDRCRETADIICPRIGLPYTVHPELRERDFGPVTGLMIREAVRRRDAAVRNEADPTEWAGVPGVESDGKMTERLWAFLNPLSEENAGKTLLLVTHGGILRVLTISVTGIQLGRPWRFVLANAAINLFEVQRGVWRVRTFGLEPASAS